MPEVTIKIRAFPYYKEVDDPVTGGTRRVERIARRGEKVDLDDVDFSRAERFDAIVSDADRQLQEDIGDPNASVETTAVEDLAAWIRESRPTVSETVDAAEDDPNVAARLLEAENLATGQQPRQGVVDGLNKIIAADDSGD